MAREYLERLQSLLQPVTGELPAGAELTVKHFFSGAAAYADGRICITLTPVGLAMKLPEAARTRLLEDGGAPLRYFPDGPAKKDYVVLPDGMVEDQAALKHWARRSIDHVLTLPRPRTRKPKPKAS